VLKIAPKKHHRNGPTQNSAREAAKRAAPTRAAFNIESATVIDQLNAIHAVAASAFIKGHSGEGDATPLQFGEILHAVALSVNDPNALAVLHKVAVDNIRA
jgi:hypothetical protein